MFYRLNSLTGSYTSNLQSLNSLYVIVLVLEGPYLKTVVTVTISAGEHGYVNGDFINISGGAPNEYNGAFEVTSVPTAGTFTYSSVAGDTITDSSVDFYKIQNNIQVDIGHGTTALYDFGQAFYDLELSQSTTNSKILRGKVNLIRELNG